LIAKICPNGAVFLACSSVFLDTSLKHKAKLNLG
jgi:predicted methyltransferase MtxX (methanogen marker protein 4)